MEYRNWLENLRIPFQRAPCAPPKLQQGNVRPFISLGKYVIFILTKQTNVLFVLKLTIPPSSIFFHSLPPCPRCFHASSCPSNEFN